MTPHQGQFILLRIQDHIEQLLPVFTSQTPPPKILIHPSGLTGPGPLGGCSPVTINEGSLIQEGGVY